MVTFDYSMGFDGERFQETTTLTTAAAPVMIREEWWRDIVFHPVRRFLTRLVNGDVVSIVYKYV